MPSKTYDIVSIFRTIIGLLSDKNHSAITLEELSIACNITKKSLLPILNSLEKKGWINEDHNTNTYSIGMKLLFFSRKNKLDLELVRQLAPAMDHLSKECNQTVELNILDGLSCVCLHKVEPEKSICIASRVGRQGPLHAGATGKVLLAFAKDSVKDAVLASPLTRYSENTITDLQLLVAELSCIKRQRFAQSVEELDPGAGAVAVPLLNDNGNLIAGISIIGTKFNYYLEKKFWLEKLVETTASLPTVKQKNIKHIC